jgi:hypothetical protein
MVGEHDGGGKIYWGVLTCCLWSFWQDVSPWPWGWLSLHEWRICLHHQASLRGSIQLILGEQSVLGHWNEFQSSGTLRFPSQVSRREVWGWSVLSASAASWFLWERPCLACCISSLSWAVCWLAFGQLWPWGAGWLRDLSWHCWLWCCGHLLEQRCLMIGPGRKDSGSCLIRFLELRSFGRSSLLSLNCVDKLCIAKY